MKYANILQAEPEPMITVLMSVFNTKEEYLREAIESILNQSFRDFEFIIFNDCSNEKTTAVLRGYHDKRIKLIENSQNRGLTKNLNTGLTLAKGKYIARMDGDDISRVDRLKIQYTYMERHPDVDILGGATINEAEKHIAWRPFSQEWRRVALLFNNYGIRHPTAFFRAAFIKKNEVFYNEEYDMSQDYELWTRVLKIGKMAVCKEPILYYRRHTGQISTNGGTSHRQKELSAKLRKTLFQELVSNAEDTEYDQLLNLEMEILSPENLSELFIRIIAENQKKELYSAYYLKNELALRWFWILRGVIPRSNIKEYRKGYWFRYIMTPCFIMYFIKNRFLRSYCESRKVYKHMGDKLQ